MERGLNARSTPNEVFLVERLQLLEEASEGDAGPEGQHLPPDVVRDVGRPWMNRHVDVRVISDQGVSDKGTLNQTKQKRINAKKTCPYK